MTALGNTVPRSRRLPVPDAAVTPSYSEPVLRVGVRLPLRAAGFGEFLADVTALEAAGADSIWLEADAKPAAAWWIRLGAILAVTHRVSLGVIAPSENAMSGELGAALETIQTLSGGRACGAVRSIDRSGSVLRIAAGRWPVEGADAESWAEANVGKDRAAWREALGAHAAAGHPGVVFAWDPRLVDLLRNSDAEDDRSDLLISTG